MGKLASLWERIERTDGLIDYFSAMRAHGRGDRDCGRGAKADSNSTKTLN
ncbi:MAG: hypothetical protein PHF80_05345 [Methanothrix sp.]|nr:hypothetical protein [Methanothrix sp.]